jgi:hypothetical protein
MISRHGPAVLATILAIVAVVLLAADQAHAAVWAALAAIVLAFAGAAIGNRAHR